jgi:vitamin B12 transporter
MAEQPHGGPASFGRKSYRLAQLAAAVSLSATAQAAAQSAVREPGEQVVITASRLAITDLESPNFTDVISVGTTTGAADLGQALAGVPGVHVEPGALRGAVSSLYVRGADPNHTIVMLEGIRLNDSTNIHGGSYDPTDLPLINVDRIELVSGALSSTYGSNALAGAVNVILQDGASTPVATISVAGGEEDFYRVGGALRGALGNAGFSLGAAYDDEDDPSRGLSFRGYSFAGKLAALSAGEPPWKAVARYARHREASFPEDSGGPRYAVLRELERRDIEELTFGAVYGVALAPSARLVISANTHERHEDSTSPGVAPGLRDPFGVPPSATQSRFARRVVQADLHVQDFVASKLVVGAAYEHESGRLDSVLDLGGFPLPANFSSDRSNLAAYLEGERSFGRLAATAGLRIDVPEGFKSAISERIGLSWWTLDARGVFKLAYGEGFKTPSFFALAHPIVGNPDLRPETSRTLEGGYELRTAGDLELGIRGFWNDYHDLIDFVAGPPPQLANLSDVTTRGFEIAASVPVSARTRVRTWLAFVEIESPDVLEQRPRWRAGAELFQRWTERFETGFRVSYLGTRYDSTIPTGLLVLSDAVILDASATWHPSPQWSLLVQVQNITETEYEVSVGLPAPDSRFRMQIVRDL